MSKQYLPKEDYVPYAPDMVGEQIRIEHCHPGRAKLYIRRTENGIVAYCHHCNLGGRNTTNMETLATGGSHERANSGNSVSEQQSSISLPHDSEGRADYWPNIAREWAGQFLSEEELTESPFVWSESKGGICFPFFSAGDLVGYQVRHFPAKEPKYMTYRKKAGGKNAPYMPYAAGGDDVIGTPLVIVEDWVSAWKAHLAGYACIAVMSTNLPKEQLLYTVEWDVDPKQGVIVALDNDNLQVKKAQAKLVRQLSAYVPVRSVLLERDLKHETIERIQEILA